MRKAAWLITALAVCASGCATTGLTAEGRVVRAKNKVLPALVHIRPVKEVYTGGTKEEMVVVGSGSIITPDGYVVTNEHVAGASKSVRCVLYDKDEVEADVVGTDRYTDLAVLKLKTDRKDLPCVKFGVSKTLEPGQTVLALGSPLGLARSVSMGIVSVTDRYLGDSDDLVSPFNNWIQTDAAINQGNSGGPLVNLKGEMVGVNARKIRAGENVGFAIPGDIAKEVVDQIIANGRVKRSWLGINLQEMMGKTDDPSQKGVIIGDVDPLSPAFDAQVKPGDILLHIDGEATNARFEEEIPRVNKLIADLPIGNEVTLHIKRGDEEIDIKTKTAEKADLKGEEVDFPAWNFTAAEVTPAIMRRAQLPTLAGVYVLGVQVGGIAANAQLSEGDIIFRVDNEEVPSMAAFKQIYEKRVQAKQRLVLLDVRRGALGRFVLLKMEPEHAPQQSNKGKPAEGPSHDE
ncbi:MAG TPA: trypsin-like peptidase domain-containing protein [Candidatus Hydrogenedentes bacterium]|nr:trypsin-like peptidase domain-containing protein [Candidatus Hydrogenedentota bacterium]